MVLIALVAIVLAFALGFYIRESIAEKEAANRTF